ncbi:hypothetical protein EWM64_g4506 [Hericium alpestre]|uniref:Integrase catalytic domain-containing protein n=1 Tax=Hericium alpestre TaxID=135208 RepID=A0A4Y9ZY84_9AGAM|nr:hypothetical protein EWM64_g4506 [Hericium alpestre]
MLSLSDNLLDKFCKAYNLDPTFKSKWIAPPSPFQDHRLGQRFFKDDQGLLFFEDVNASIHLCIPKCLQPRFLELVHCSMGETARAGAEKLRAFLAHKIYWPRMNADIERYCTLCDIRQKTKARNFKKYGLLIPNPIPNHPFQSISMDLIVSLPMSELFNVILVVVCRLSKYVQFIPTTSGLSAADFTKLFTDKIICHFGVSDSIISDRDPRWTHNFWKAVSQHLGLTMHLSSSHHPQHNGQTEITNRALETALHAYVAQDKASWASWLSLLEFAHNTAISSTMGYSPAFLLYGFQPSNIMDAIIPMDQCCVSCANIAGDFLLSLDSHRAAACDAMAHVQHNQAQQFNKGCHPLEFNIGDLVLVNLHSLVWKESKGEGAKLVQCLIGSFEVQQQINDNVYHLCMGDNFPGSTVFNVQHLQPYQASLVEFSERITLPDTHADKPPLEEFEVGKIVTHCKTPDQAAWNSSSAEQAIPLCMTCG